MEIIIISTGQTMYEGEFRSLYPNTSLPQHLSVALLTSLGAAPLLEGPQASGGTVYQYSQRQGVEQIGGQWFTKYILGPVFTDSEATETVPAQTAAEQEAAYKAAKEAEQAVSVRASRATKLAETDWRFRSDMTPSQGWIDYCQALRDVTAQAGFPYVIEWPVSP